MKNTLLSVLREQTKGMDLDTLIQEIQIMEADEIPDNPSNLKGWYAVVDTTGVNAYFTDVQEALRYRLSLINTLLNSY